ncbi:hypothetical protein BCR37DRAFT_377407 [Protomyces lactucae-debilis]|uniref:Uncharacterized protein n=1 Tax=Protomyces lactucae-debilis TaxID=2754530 RepID=A0A1Y2FQ20_PROLT|nr:uncharacterized protein BCR37DRAFT_377407 [Protomyces lactucae-debilis]ORY85697.1 hypothetical protein BCR37DRAFT_377407 [Protomyces lactucae-debilis]
MNLWALMAYTSLLSRFLIAHASPEAGPQAPSVRKRPPGSSSGQQALSNATGAEEEPRSKVGKAKGTRPNLFVLYDSKCYHLRFEVKRLLNPEKFPQLTQEDCETRCKQSIIKYCRGKEFMTRKHQKTDCIRSGHCIRSRAINITERSCSDRLTAAAALQTCYLEGCACSATVDVWRIKRYGPATPNDQHNFFGPRVEGKALPLCHPENMVKKFEANRWQIGKWSVVQTDIDCDEVLTEEDECSCTGPGKRPCKAVETFTTSRCALDNPGPHGGCICAAEHHRQCMAETGPKSPAADEVSYFAELENEFGANYFELDDLL